jgi:transposase
MLERECGRNVELMWLVGKLRPDFKTIADFRKENRKSFKGVFRNFVLLCKQMGLVGGRVGSG